MEIVITISDVENEQDVDAIRNLMQGYLVWHGKRYHEYRDHLDKYFDYEGYQREMDQLPGDYAPPKGRLLIARRGKEVLGCVALRGLEDNIAEMKRLFVKSEAQGLGVGKRLAKSVMRIARELGYATMRLDTGPLQTEAVSMYQTLGFKFIEPYYDLPNELGELLVFMQCDLANV